MFDDRRDAGRRLAHALRRYKGDATAIVLAIPRGGVEVGYQVAVQLQLPFTVLIARKLPFPDNPESGFGAIAEEGGYYLYPNTVYWLSEKTVGTIIKQQEHEITRRRRLFRGDVPLPDLTGKTAIIVDDGIAMGSTVRAAIDTCRHKRASKIVVAAPVAGTEVVNELRHIADEIVILETPANFFAVAQVYRQWYDVPDREVQELLARYPQDVLRQ